MQLCDLNSRIQPTSTHTCAQAIWSFTFLYINTNKLALLIIYNTCIKLDPKAHTTRSENFSRLDNVSPETFEHNHHGRIKINELIGSYIAILELSSKWRSTGKAANHHENNLRAAKTQSSLANSKIDQACINDASTISKCKCCIRLQPQRLTSRSQIKSLEGPS